VSEILTARTIEWCLRSTEEGELKTVYGGVLKGYGTVPIEMTGVIPPFRLKFVMRSVVAGEYPPVARPRLLKH
jgi:hypothetical protein